MDWLGLHGGGTLTIEPGAYHVAQAKPDETVAANLNAALAVLGNDIVLAGTNADGSGTMLIADNRATTILSIGKDQIGDTFPIHNFTLRNITLVGQPHLAARTNTSAPYGYTNQIAHGQLQALDAPGVATPGCQISLYGSGSGSSYDLLISNCVILNGIQTMVLNGSLSNLMIRDCTFVQWDATNSFTAIP